MLNKTATNLSILIVDDEALVVSLMEEMLRKYFRKIDVAYNGQEAFELYKKNQYDIIITDISMPVMNGIELAKKVVEMNPSQEIIVISAHNDTEYFIELIKFRTASFIQKPIGDNLFELIGDITEKIYNKKLVEKYHTYLKEDSRFVRKNILLSTKDGKITNLLNKKSYEALNVKASALIDTASEDIPNMIILDDQTDNLEELIKTIVETEKIKYIPLVLLAYKDDKKLHKKLFKIGLYDIIAVKEGMESFLNRVEHILESERFSFSKTNKFIRYFSEFHKTVGVSNRMKLIATTLGNYFNLSDSKIFDIKNALTLISTTFNNVELKDLLKLYYRLQYAKPIYGLCSTFETSKSIESNIIKAVYYITKQKLEGVNEADVTKLQEVDEKILNKALEFSKANTVLLTRPKDVERATDFLKDIFSQIKDIGIDVDLYLERLENLLYDFMLHHIDILINTKTSNKKVTITIEPQKQSSETLELVENTQFQENVNLSCIDHHLIFEIGEKTKEPEPFIESKPKEVTESVKIEDFESSKSQIAVEKTMEIIDAHQFIERLEEEEHDLEFLDELVELEEDLEDTITADEITRDSIEIVSIIITKYAKHIDNLYEFEKLTKGLQNFAANLAKFVNDTQAEVNLNKIVVFMEAIQKDLKSWREGIFLYKTVDNIHFLDASLISSMQQVELFLQPAESDDDDEDIFFF